MADDNTPLRELTPVRTAFMIPRVVGMAVLLTVLTGAGSLAALASGLWFLVLPLPILWIVGLGFSVFAANVAFKKERYEVHPTHLIGLRGGLLSDGRSELDVKNITHVRLRLPWLRHRFFKIGDVRVESAGSSASEITFRSILEPEQLYRDLQHIMQKNGYQLERNDVLHEESPTALGALTDIGQNLIGAVFGLFWLALAGGGMFIGIASELGGALGTVVMLAAAGAGLGLACLVIAGLGVRFLDITRRTYTVYDDTVEYTEGFLTRDNAFIPAENIADANTNRTFIDQIVGLYDVSVSCQGSGSEVKFRRLSNGPALQEAIARVVSDTNARERVRQEAEEAEAAAKVAEQGVEGAAEAAPRRVVRKRRSIPAGEAWTADLRMDIKRALVPTLFLIPALPLFVVAAIGVFIQASRTVYRVGADSVSRSFSFIGSQQQDFSYDKITGVQITRSFIDKWMGTLSIQLWSIGAPMPLSMSSLREDDVNVQALLRQCGIDSTAEAQGELEQSYNLKVFLITAIPTAIALVLLMGFMVVAALLGAWPLLFLVPLLMLAPVLGPILHRLRTDRQRVTFHADHMETQTGILIRQHCYVRYDNIKKVESVAIPFTEQGKFKVYVAGERVIQQQNGKQGQGAKLPYSIQGMFVHDIAARVDTMDALLKGQIEPSEILATPPEQSDDVVIVTKPSVLNAVVPMVVIGLVLWPLLPLAALVGWQVYVRTYTVERDRVVKRGGILYKSVTSVLYNRIDTMQRNQGALGKAFGNGRVTLLTAGSSSPDLLIADVPDYEEVYGSIREHYGKH